MDTFRSSSFGLALLISLGAFAGGQAADVVTPMEIVRSSNEAILVILAEHDPLDDEGEARVYEVMDRVTDFAAMAHGAVGDSCTEFSIAAETCDEWKRVFGDLLRIRSIKEVGRFRADRFDYLNEEIDGERAVVNTLAYYDGDEVTLDYELSNAGIGWVVVNYIVDDVDTVESWRRRFARLLRDETIEDVIARLRERIQELREQS